MITPLTPETARYILAELDRLNVEELAKLAKLAAGNETEPPLAAASRASVNAVHRLLAMLDCAAGGAVLNVAGTEPPMVSAEVAVCQGGEISPGVVENRFDDAVDFLRALHPLSGLWKDPSNWIYRGHADATWALLPTAHRDDAWKPLEKLGSDPYSPSLANDSYRAFHEKELMRQFVDAIDLAGLPVPNGLNFMQREIEDRGDPWPFESVLPLLALAQHHGLPTRLLDWTRQSRFAAYFAGQENSATALAMWGLNSDFVDRVGDGAPPTLRIGSAPRSTNPNMHAQAGLFTYCQRIPDGKPQSLEGLIGAWMASADLPDQPTPCVLRKLTLVGTQRERLLSLLTLEGVSALSMFPGYDGVARHVVECVQCNSPGRGTTYPTEEP